MTIAIILSAVAATSLAIGFGSADTTETVDVARGKAAEHGRRMLSECEKIYGKGNMAADCAMAGLLRHAYEYRSQTYDRIYRDTK